ncbi:hypothetical protein JOD55_001069 [Arcanobacterium pluranimalium]|uniref:hypothetical protein n=1 Tax=Arcanobacterium pluranimalium TaxID=108028 RepID=UPI00195A77BB|nr:hypothetical protein [Arcanobacterium pluranimalium]MBM7825242.1 hypothetical protein [Arcanobacterium pluranimalium]
MFTLYSIVDVPLLSQVRFDPQVIVAESGADRIGSLNSAQVVEMDILNDVEDLDTSTGAAIGQELKYAVARRILLWVAVVETEHITRLQAALGADIVRIAGDAFEVPEHLRHRFPAASLVTPVVVSPNKLLKKLLSGTDSQREWVRNHLEGIDSKGIASENFSLLKQAEVNIVERSLFFRMFRSPKFIAYLVVFIYSSLRALPVVFVPHFHGNVWVLWSLDVFTAVPYTWALIEMFAGRTWMRRFAGLVVAMATFVAPYIYFWTNGKHYPPIVNVIVIGFIVAAIAIELYRWGRDKKVSQIVSDSFEVEDLARK